MKKTDTISLIAKLGKKLKKKTVNNDEWLDKVPAYTLNKDFENLNEFAARKRQTLNY